MRPSHGENKENKGRLARGRLGRARSENAQQLRKLESQMNELNQGIREMKELGMNGAPESSQILTIPPLLN